MRERDFLKETLGTYGHLPSYALWRAIELRYLSRLDFVEPILDLGCGDGKFARMLFGADATVVGIDLAQNALRQARTITPFVLKADATCLPFPDASFGSILSNCVMEHIPSDEAVVAEMHRVLRPGGMAAITVPAPDLKAHLYLYQRYLRQSRPVEAQEYLEEFDQRLTHLHYRTGQEWQDIFSKAGFVETETIPYLPPAVIRMWSRLEWYFTQPVAAIATSRWKLWLYFLMLWFCRGRLLHRVLRKYYSMNPQSGEQHGGWLVVARKSR